MIEGIVAANKAGLLCLYIAWLWNGFESWVCRGRDGHALSLFGSLPSSQRAAELWRQTGALWEQENEDDLKDKMDFLLTPPDLYPAGGELTPSLLLQRDETMYHF